MLHTFAHGDVVEMRIDRPPANALNHELLEAVIAAIDDAVAAGARALVLAGREGMFCAGIDVPELLGQDRASIERFWGLLFGAARALASCPVPVAAALAGHSPAGGAVLAAHCDYRVAADGNFKIGFNEVAVGLPLPTTIMQVFADLVGSRTARRYGSEGRMMKMQEALEIGLVDELAPAERVLPQALEYLESLLALPPVAMNRTRRVGKAHVLAALESSDDVARTVDAWFSDETQREMDALVASLKK